MTERPSGWAGLIIVLKAEGRLENSDKKNTLKLFFFANFSVHSVSIWVFLIYFFIFLPSKSSPNKIGFDALGSYPDARTVKVRF